MACVLLASQVCAFAVNHWKLGQELSTSDPSTNPFHRGLALSSGAVLVLDRAGVALSRVWVAYEVSAAISTAASRPDFLFDVYTSQDGGKGVGLADGATVSDGGPGATGGAKAQRERKFPLALAQSVLNVTLENGTATVEADRVRILNRVAGMPNLAAPPPRSHIGFDKLNANMRSKLAAATIVRIFSEPKLPEPAIAATLEALHSGKLRTLTLNFDSCGAAFTEFLAKRLANNLPDGLIHLSLKLSGHGDVFLSTLAKRHANERDLLGTLRTLDLSANELGKKRVVFQEEQFGVGMRELCAAIRGGFLGKLDTLKLDGNKIDDLDMRDLLRTMAVACEQLAFLSLDANRLGPDAMLAFAKTLKNLDAAPSLDRLVLVGNLAPAHVVDAVMRALKARGRNKSDCFKQNFKQ